MAENFDVIIIGAGASGLMCAFECTKRGRRTAVLDHSPTVARKVRIAGGGRCNFTNMHVSSEDYISTNPHFVKSALARYTPWDFIAFLGSFGISGTEEDNGKMFCDQGGDAVAEALIRAASEQSARIMPDVEMQDAVRDGSGFRLHTSAGTFECESLVIAAGGMSWPQVGATDLSYTVADRFGMGSVPLRPGLVPLNVPSELQEFCRSLAGVSLPAAVRTPSASLAGDLLFTHKGISGPAVLEASLFWMPGRPVTIDFLPGIDLLDALSDFRRMELRNGLARLMPRRLARALCDRFELHGIPAEMSSGAMEALKGNVHEFSFTPSGTGGYKKAEVTLGGIDTSCVSSKTMESTVCPGLYCIGEGLDVTGRLGGFNLHWAWASGAAAGRIA